MITIKFESEGKFDHFSRSFDEVIAESVKDVATVCAERARSLAPVRTGRLRRSIHYVASGSRAHVIADVDYASRVEYGVPGRFEGRFYMRRALEQASKESRDIWRENIRKQWRAR